MPRTAEANQFLKEKRKKQILICALKLFCLEGYENITMDRIAKESKISHGLIYHYFDKKSDILQELMKESKRKFSLIFDLENMKNLKGADFFKAMTDFIISAVTLGEEYAFFIALYLNFKISPDMYEQFGQASYFKNLENNFKIAQEDGIYQAGNPKEYLFCYFYLIRSITMAAITSKNTSTIPSAEVVLNLFKRSII